MADLQNNPAQEAQEQKKSAPWPKVRLNVMVTKEPRLGKADSHGIQNVYLKCAIRSVEDGWVDVMTRGTVASTMQMMGVGKGYSMTVTGARMPANPKYPNADPQILAYGVRNIESPAQRKELRAKREQSRQAR